MFAIVKESDTNSQSAAADSLAKLRSVPSQRQSLDAFDRFRQHLFTLIEKDSTKAAEFESGCIVLGNAKCTFTFWAVLDLRFGKCTEDLHMKARADMLLKWSSCSELWYNRNKTVSLTSPQLAELVVSRMRQLSDSGSLF